MSFLTELAFGDYITHQFGFFTKQMTDLKTENNKLTGESEAKDIKLKLSRFHWHTSIV